MNKSLAVGGGNNYIGNVFHYNSRQGDDTVPNALKIDKYLETTRGSEPHKWYDKIILKEK